MSIGSVQIFYKGFPSFFDKGEEMAC